MDMELKAILSNLEDAGCGKDAIAFLLCLE